MKSWRFNRDVFRFKLEDIFYFESCQRKITVHTNSGAYRIQTTISKEESALCGMGFIRVHQGYLVHISYIRGLRDNYLVLHNGKQIPVSSRRRKMVYERLMRGR